MIPWFYDWYCSNSNLSRAVGSRSQPRGERWCSGASLLPGPSGWAEAQICSWGHPTGSLCGCWALAHGKKPLLGDTEPCKDPEPCLRCVINIRKMTFASVITGGFFHCFEHTLGDPWAGRKEIATLLLKCKFLMSKRGIINARIAF